MNISGDTILIQQIKVLEGLKFFHYQLFETDKYQLNVENGPLF